MPRNVLVMDQPPRPERRGGFFVPGGRMTELHEKAQIMDEATMGRAITQPSSRKRWRAPWKQ